MIEHDQIVEKLDQLAERHEDLRGIRDLVGPDLVPSKEFLSAVYAGDVPVTRSSLLVRAILEDPNLYGMEATPPHTELHKRVLLFLQNHPRHLLDPFLTEDSRGDAPNFLCAHKGVSRPTIQDVLSDYVFEPLFKGVEDQGLEDLLWAVMHTQMLSTNQSERLLSEGASSKVTRRFFDTGSRPLDIRNSLYHALALLDETGHGGRLQSKIPVSLSYTLAIPRVSLPALMAVCDLLSLTVVGAITLEDVDSSSDQVRFFQEVTRWTDYLDIFEIAQRHRARAMLDGESAHQMQQRMESGIRDSVYRTGQLFNAPRLYEGGKEVSAFTAFDDVYQQIDDERLEVLCRAHYMAVAPWFWPRLQAAIAGQSLSGMQIRSVANIAYYGWYLADRELNPQEYMPTVAKYFLGMPEYEAKGERRARSKRPQKRTEPYRLGALDDLIDSVSCDTAYLLYPGYAQRLPTDGVIYFPRALAAGYENLPDMVELVGPDTLTLGHGVDEVLACVAGKKNVVKLQPE